MLLCEDNPVIDFLSSQNGHPFPPISCQQIRQGQHPSKASQKNSTNSNDIFFDFFFDSINQFQSIPYPKMCISTPDPKWMTPKTRHWSATPIEIAHWRRTNIWIAIKELAYNSKICHIPPKFPKTNPPTVIIKFSLKNTLLASTNFTVSTTPKTHQYSQPKMHD